MTTPRAHSARCETHLEPDPDTRPDVRAVVCLVQWRDSMETCHPSLDVTGQRAQIEGSRGARARRRSPKGQGGECAVFSVYVLTSYVLHALDLYIVR